MSMDIACCEPLAAPALTEEAAAETAELFRALGDPARVRIVNVLATSSEPVCICNLVEPLALSQPTVSHHMKKLADVGIVDREQRGRMAYYRLRPAAVEALASVADLRGGCC
jgi:ArsR family transcriptional regulator, arsenate/arsenite/antimonite-responsive transcriptional repressor